MLWSVNHDRNHGHSRTGITGRRHRADSLSLGGFPGLMAVDWFQKAVALLVNDKLSDPKLAIEYLNEAIRLKPDDAADFARGAAYANLWQHQQAIKDYVEIQFP
jgi:tetratricopeptide (TPR) repeat protein